MNLAAILKIAPFAAIAALLLVVLFIRGDKIKAEQARDKALYAAETYRKANETNQATIQRLSQASLWNAAIASQMAQEVKDNRDSESRTYEALDRAERADPKVRDWGSTPVPDSVRNALASR